MTENTRRRIELLLAPTVVFVAVVAGVMISPYFHLIPGMGRPCGLRQWTGYPCLACGGTRSVQALADGNILAALKFNPLVFLAICSVAIWFVMALFRAARMSATSPATQSRSRSKVRWWLAGLGLAGVVNWIYLVKYLPA